MERQYSYSRGTRTTQQTLVWSTHVEAPGAFGFETSPDLSSGDERRTCGGLACRAQISPQ